MIGPHAIWMYSSTDDHKHAVPPGEFLAGSERGFFHAECGHKVVRAWPSETPDYPPPCDACLMWWYAGLRDQ